MSTSSMTYTYSTVVAAASSSVGISLPKHDVRNTIVGAVVGVFGLILFVGGAFLIRRCARSRRRNGGDGRGGPLGDTKDPVARIVPLGTPRAEGHSYYRSTLGRIAIRRPDGGWDFAHPNEPYLPSGISDPYPSPASVRTTFFSSHKFQRDASETSNPAILEYKAQESRAAQMIRLGYDARDHDLEMGDRHLPHPPPAYGQEPSVATY